MRIERLITERQALRPLCHQFGHAVFAGMGVAIVGETPGKAIEQPDALIHLAEQQAATIVVCKCLVILTLCDKQWPISSTTVTFPG